MRVVQEAIDGLTWRIDLWQTFVDEYNTRLAKEPLTDLSHWYKGRKEVYELVIESLSGLLEQIEGFVQINKLEG